VVNADADEFVTWLHADNLTGGKGRGRLRAANLRKNAVDHSGVWPAMIYMTDIAFGSRHASKRAFLKQMAGFTVTTGAHTLVPPPICLSTPAQVDGSMEWHKQGVELAADAEAGSGATVIVGPSPLLNDEGDSFRTVLPAGYLVLARILGVRQQGLEIVNVAPPPTKGRFAVLFHGAESLEESLDRLIGIMQSPVAGRSDALCYAADYFLYVVLQLYAALRPQEEARFWHGFCFERSHPDSLPAEFNKSSMLNVAAFASNDWCRFAIAQNFYGTDRRVSSVYQGPEGGAIPGNNWETVQEHLARYRWFDNVRRQVAPSTSKTDEMTRDG